MSATLCRVGEPTAGWVRSANADAWQVLGVAGTQVLPGVRLMATGLPHPQWNSGYVDEPGDVDIAAVRRWYDERGLRWGLAVPAGAAWPHGRKLLTMRLMGMVPPSFVPVDPPQGTTIRTADAADLATYLHVDTVAFDESPDVQRPWLELLLAHDAATIALAQLDGEVVASGHVVLSSGRAGPAAYVGGIAVLPQARRRGIGAAISTWLVEHAFAAGATLAHLHPDTEDAARIYRRLGFVEVDGLDIYLPIS